MLSRKRELATADMNSHGHSDGYSRICSWAIHMMSFDVIDLLISLFHYHQREIGGSLLEGGWGQRGAIRPEEVYWGSLLGKSTGQQGPSRLPPGLDGGGLGKEGEGGGGNPRHHTSPGSMVADVCWPPARHHISVKTLAVMV